VKPPSLIRRLFPTDHAEDYVQAGEQAALFAFGAFLAWVSGVGWIVMLVGLAAVKAFAVAKRDLLAEQTEQAGQEKDPTP
jgi:hypothetical protein